MEVLLLLIPLSALIVFGAVAMFFRAVDSGQFEDLERQGRTTLFEERLEESSSERQHEGERHELDRHSVQTR